MRSEAVTDESEILFDDTQEYSCHEGPSSFSNGGPFQTNIAVEDAIYTDTEITEILENSMNSVEEVTVYEVVTEYRPRPDVGQLIHNYSHIFIQLCDGEIINAESIIDIDLTQFITNNGLEKQSRLDTESIPPSQISPRSLHIDIDDVASTQEHGRQQTIVISTDAQPNQLMISSEQLSQPSSQLTNLSEQLSQLLLAHEEVVSTSDQLVNEVDKEVIGEIRNLIADFRPERW